MENNACNPEAANQQNQQNNCCCEKKKTWKGKLISFLGGIVVGGFGTLAYQNRDKVMGYFQKKSQKGGEQ